VGETTGSSLVRQSAGISVVRETTGISVVADIAVASHSLFAAGGDPTSAGPAHGSGSSTAAASGSSLRGGPRLGDGVIRRMSALYGLTRSGPRNRLRPQGGQAWRWYHDHWGAESDEHPANRPGGLSRRSPRLPRPLRDPGSPAGHP